MTPRRLVPFLAVSLSIVTACGPSDSTGADGGLIPPFDAGRRIDAAPGSDAGEAPDAGPSDLDASEALPDASTPDASTPDASTPDASTPDGGPDASTPDAGPMTCAEMDLGSAIGDAVATGTTSGDDLPTSCGAASAPDMVYRWTAPSTATWLFDTTGSSIDALVQIWDSCAATGGRDCGSGPRLARLVAGTSVILVVEGALAESGTFVLGIRQAPTMETLCDDGIDEDFDGAADCGDADCDEDAACTETLCADGLDDDVDGDIDCDDSDCDTSPDCVETLCANGLDDDRDGDGDCRDSDCDGLPGCIETLCGNGIDDDGDTYVDCTDYDCAFELTCGEYSCDDVDDDELDGAIDCADSECRCDAACFTMAPTCAATELGSMLGSPATTGMVDPYSCGTNEGTCGGEGPEVSFRWTAPSAGTYVFSTNSTGGLAGLYDTVLYVRDGTCAGAELGCNDDTTHYQSEVTLTLTAGQSVIVVIDSYAVGEGGRWVLNIARP